MSQDVPLLRVNVKRIFVTNNSIYLKKVVDGLTGNVLWSEQEELNLSVNWINATRVLSKNNRPLMYFSIEGFDNVPSKYTISYKLYAKVNSGDEYTLKMSGTLKAPIHEAERFVPDQNRYYKLVADVTTNMDDWADTSVESEIFVDYIKAVSPTWLFDTTYTNYYVGEVVELNSLDIDDNYRGYVISNWSSGITVDSQSYGTYYVRMPSEPGYAWVEAYCPGDISYGILDSDVARNGVTVKSIGNIVWNSSNVYSLGNTVRFTINNFPSGAVSAKLYHVSAVRDGDMFTIAPWTLVSSSSSNSVYDLELSVYNSGTHVYPSDAILGAYFTLEVDFYNSSGNVVASAEYGSPRKIGYCMNLPESYNLYYNKNEQHIIPQLEYEFAANAVSYSGTASATNAGSYYISASLVDTEMWQWSDGSTSAKSFNWKILPAYWEANQGNADNWLEVQNGVVRIRIYDYPNGAASNVGPFSGTYKLYQVGITNPVDSGGFSATPGDAGNIYFNTSVVPLPGASYYYEATVNAHGSNYAQTSVKSTSKELVSGGVHTNVGGSVTYLYNYDSTSGYGARFTFTKSATQSVYVVIQRKNVSNGETSYSAWREYHFMVGDGNKSWTDKATMLIKKSDGTWSVSSSAWYYKNGNSWGVEIGLDTGCQYLVTEIGADPSSSMYLLCYNATTRLAYNGSNQYAWNQSSAIGSVTSGTKYAAKVGGYSCTITKSENAVWEDTMTRFDYVRSFDWGIYGNWTGGGNPKLVVGGDFGSAWTNPVTGGTYSKREVYGCIYDYPNGTMTTSKRVTGTIKLYKDGSLLLEKSFTSAPNASGNVPIPTGHTVTDSTYYAIITINEANYMTGLTNYRTDNFVHTHTWGSPTYTSDGSSSHTIREVCTKCDAVRTTTGAHTWDGNYTYSASHGSSTHARTDHCTYCNQARTVNKEHTDGGTGYRYKYNGNKTHERANVCKYCNKRYNIVTKNCTRPSGSKKCKYCDNNKSWHS